MKVTLVFSAAIKIVDSRPEAYMSRAEAYMVVGEMEKTLILFNMKTLLPEIIEDIDTYIRDAEGFKTKLVKVTRKDKNLEAEADSLEQQMESENRSVLQEPQTK